MLSEWDELIREIKRYYIEASCYTTVGAPRERQRDKRVSNIIGASLSEPHTSGTALLKCVCIASFPGHSQILSRSRGEKSTADTVV